MAWETFKDAVRHLTGASQTDGEDVVLSRRTLLTGLGLAGACAVAGPALFWSDDAEADVVQVQYRDRDHHRGRGRHDHHDRHHGSRHSRSDIRRRCRDWRYRRRNERLCNYARGRGGRRGTCVTVGPVRVCD